MPLKTYQDPLPELNLTPMIDVVFLLIIFFMAGTKFAEYERTVQLEVPRVSQLGALAAVPEKRVVHVHRDGTLQLDQQEVSLEDLETQLRTSAAETPTLAIVVRGDAAGPFQHVATVLTCCRNAGVHDLGISVQLDSSTPNRR